MTPQARFRKPSSPPSERELAEDAAWREYAEDSLDRARASAEQWRTGLGLLVTVMAAGLMLGGPGRMADLSPVWRGVVTAVLGFGFAVALHGLWAASRAAAVGGSGPVDRDRMRGRHGSLASYKTAAAARSWSDIRRARIALLISLPVIVVMTLTSWWLPRGTPSGGQEPRPQVLVVTTGALLCGELAGGAKTFTILTDKSGTPRRVPAAEVVSLTVVDSCPL
ncbi:hypothetical protein [Streptomyces europaeiscabiei]|uniref:hypothetical protein n=1 Tax=Streptomyces europaeiscabiei TaxID=146819 RepID=UPI002E2E3648|nr:hypothetical protein [Streptomyces europaeiscabiei]